MQTQSTTPRRKSIHETFWDHVVMLGECWDWTRAKNKDGYGVLFNGVRQDRAHRHAWMLANGVTIPEGMVVRHRCDNPSCVNPAHLLLGTQADNMRDRFERGPWKARPRNTHCKRGHAISGDNVVNVGRTQTCRICWNEYMRNYRRHHKRQSG